MTPAVAITIFVIGLLAAIMIHEWGHLVTARRFGIRADRFFLGFGPTLWSTRRGETEYGIKALPLGGFVRILGMSSVDRRLRPVADQIFDAEVIAAVREEIAQAQEADPATMPALPESLWSELDSELDRRGASAALRRQLVTDVRAALPEDPTGADAHRLLEQAIDREIPDTGRLGDLRHRLLRGDEGRFFHDRPGWQRVVVLVAGAATHFVVATLLLLGGNLLLAQPTGQILPQVGQFAEDNVAEAAGFQLGDHIVAVDGAPVKTFDDLRALVGQRPGIPIEVEIERAGTPLTIPVTPAPTEDLETGEEIGRLGFLPTFEFERLPPLDAVRDTFVGPRSVPEIVGLTLSSLGRVFGPEGIGRLAQEVGGGVERGHDGAVSVVGAAGMTGEGALTFGPVWVIWMLVAVNVFVGVFNLLPVPPLDGGHVAVLGVEKAVNAVRERRGRPADFVVDPRTIGAIALPVIAFVLTIMVALVWLDVTNPVRLN